jgi:DNA-binding MarR family transcriptional regulator
LARIEQISPQAMGVTLGTLESRGLVQRRSDPDDGRRMVMSLSAAGVELLRHKRDARARHFAKVLAEEFTAAELRALAQAAPLIERLGDHI